MVTLTVQNTKDPARYGGYSYISKLPCEKMALSNLNTRIIKVVQATDYQGDVRNGMSRSIHCSCMLLMSVCWALFKSGSIWDSFDLDSTLQKGDLTFKSLNNYRYLGMEDLPQEFFIENSSINVEFLNDRNGENYCWGISCVCY